MTDPLDPEIRAVMDALAAAAAGGPQGLELPVEEARAASDATGRRFGGELAPVARVEDRDLGGVGARVLWPAGHDGALVLWFHGGGWVVGSLDGFEAVCRALAGASGAAVAMVDYRLAPEHPFPAALDDALTATRWALAHADELGCDPARVALGGDSAGANLATVAARRVPGARVQCLVYPVCDAALDTASYRDLGEGFGLTTASMARCFELYLSGAEPLDPDVSPLRAPDLGGLPPAFVLTCSHDPLRDEGEAYSAALSAAGVVVDLRRYDGTVHGFFRWIGATDVARRAVSEAGAWLRAGLR